MTSRHLTEQAKSGDWVALRRWRLETQHPLNPAVLLYCGSALVRIAGCEVDAARTFMNTLPGAIDLLTYDYQAQQLVQQLNRQLPMQMVP